VRNYESSGPDVKIRGTAAQIAEKYSTLARDAMSSGDIVAAESYLQHAEHYNRIIMAAQSQAPANGQYAGDGYNGASGNQRQPDDFGGGYREPAYSDEARSQQAAPASRQPSPSPSAPDSPQPNIPVTATTSREGRESREGNEGGRRRRRRHQPNGADHALAEAGENVGGRSANGAARNGGAPASDESVA
jgi:hypothetical protein